MKLRSRLLIVGFAACLLGTVACSNEANVRQTDRTPITPSDVPAVVPEPSPSSSPTFEGNKFGTTVTLDGDYATMTVHGYKHNAKGLRRPDDPNYVYGALDIKFCLLKLPEDIEEVTVSGNPWVLKFDDEAYTSIDFSDATTLKPKYPEHRRVRPGSCVRGWLEFEVPKNGQLTEVQYAPDGREMIIWTM